MSKKWIKVIGLKEMWHLNNVPHLFKHITLSLFPFYYEERISHSSKVTKNERDTNQSELVIQKLNSNKVYARNLNKVLTETKVDFFC